MRISPEEVLLVLNGAPQAQGSPSRNDVGRLVGRLRTRIRKEAEEHIQPLLLLVDEAVRLFVYLERHQYSLKLTKETSPFALQISRLRSDAICFRELVLLGQEGPAHVVARTFIEGIELAMALAQDPVFAVSYMETDNNLEFWKSEIAYGNIYKRVKKFLHVISDSKAQSDQYIAAHKATKGALSGHVHIASYSSFRSGFAPSISRPGRFQVGALGSLSAHLPRLCLLFANESHIFAACCINGFMKQNLLPVFQPYRPNKKLNDFVAASYVLQELLVRHGEQLQEFVDSFLETSEPAT